jgi:hypothetical protein
LFVDEIGDWTGEMTRDRQKSDPEFLLVTSGCVSRTENMEINYRVEQRDERSEAAAIMINVFRSDIGRKRVLNASTPRSTQLLRMLSFFPRNFRERLAFSNFCKNNATP